MSARFDAKWVYTVVYGDRDGDFRIAADSVEDALVKFRALHESWLEPGDEPHDPHSILSVTRGDPVFVEVGFTNEPVLAELRGR